MSDTKFTSDHQPKPTEKTQLTRAQRIAQLEAKLARERDAERKTKDGVKYVLGGMLLNAVFKDADIRKWTIEHIEKDVTRAADLKRVADLLAELKG